MGQRTEAGMRSASVKDGDSRLSAGDGPIQNGQRPPIAPTTRQTGTVSLSRSATNTVVVHHDLSDSHISRMPPCTMVAMIVASPFVIAVVKANG
jgi:hypothetical protein